MACGKKQEKYAPVSNKEEEEEEAKRRINLLFRGAAGGNFSLSEKNNRKIGRALNGGFRANCFPFFVGSVFLPGECRRPNQKLTYFHFENQRN